MEELKKRIHDDSNGLDYVLVGDSVCFDVLLSYTIFSCVQYHFLPFLPLKSSTIRCFQFAATPLP